MNEVLFSQDVTVLDMIIRLVCLGWVIPFMFIFVVSEIVKFIHKKIKTRKEKEDGRND